MNTITAVCGGAACCAIAVLALEAQTPPARPADLILRNGKIVTVDDAKPQAQAIAINGDTITAVGSNQDVQR